jgi:hypothetical protein
MRKSPGPTPSRPSVPWLHRRCRPVRADVYIKRRQATDCPEAPSWTGRWISPRRDSWFRVWACADHLDGLRGPRQFGAPYERHPTTADRSAYPSSPALGGCEHANGGDGPLRNYGRRRLCGGLNSADRRVQVRRCRFCFRAPRRQCELPVRRFLTTTAATDGRAANDTASTVFSPQD